MDDPGLAEAATLLQRHAEATLPYEPAFHPLPPGPAAPLASIHACDGSHAVLVDNGPAWVVATTAECIAWPGPERAPPVPRIHATLAAQAAGELSAAYESRGLPAVEHVASAEGYAEAWRALEEHDAIVQTVPEIPAGGLLLVDGALHGLGDARAQALADRVRERAERAGVAVVGVAKRSGLTAPGSEVPLLPALARAGGEALPGQAWASPAPDQDGVWVARLHARAPFVFRIDAPDLDDAARLVPVCRDAVYTGYPYPLALVHNLVALTGAKRAALRAEVLDAVRVQGGTEAWALLQDFHDVLDENVP